MDVIIDVLSFAGSWLLFAGPIYQAAIELREQDLRREELEDMQLKLARPAPISAYWWFLPPVKLYLEHRRSQKYRREFLKALPDEVVQGFVDFMSKATGWVLVSAGGLLLAVKETYELTEHFHLAWYWLLSAVIIVAFVCVLFVINTLKRSESIKKKLNT